MPKPTFSERMGESATKGTILAEANELQDAFDLVWEALCWIADGRPQGRAVAREAVAIVNHRFHNDTLQCPICGEIVPEARGTGLIYVHKDVVHPVGFTCERPECARKKWMHVRHVYKVG